MVLGFEFFGDQVYYVPVSNNVRLGHSPPTQRGIPASHSCSVSPGDSLPGKHTAL